MAKSVRTGGVDFEQFSLFKHSGKENTQTTFFVSVLFKEAAKVL